MRGTNAVIGTADSFLEKKSHKLPSELVLDFSSLLS